MTEVIKDSRGYPVLVFDYPCLPLSCTQYFDHILREDFEVFEQGSGGSTIWLAQRVKKVISVEHSPEWHEAISQALAQRGLHNVELLFIPLKPQNWLNPWEDYAGAILKYRNATFDVIFIDGWDPARLPAVAYGVNKLKPSGYMIVDDTTWPMLQSIFSLLDGWDYVHLDGQTLSRTDGMNTNSRTTFFRKRS